MNIDDENRLLRALGVYCDEILTSDHEAAVIALTLFDGDHSRNTLRRALAILFAHHRERSAMKCGDNTSEMKAALE